jgi:parallel beta-helix repeat protein
MARLGVSLITAGLVLGCESPGTTVNEITNPLLRQGGNAGFTVVVAPSGDVSGVIDANNIQDALNAVKADGGTVYLTDGDATTVDHYYTSRNVVTTGFSGVLNGEGMDNTIIHAGRKSAAVGDGFEPAFAPWWNPGSAIPELATVLQFDVPSGSVTITDLSIEAKDDQPTDLTLDYYGNPATYITTLIEILGGEHDTRIENVRLEGKETGAEGNVRGTNVDAALHVMLGGPVPLPEGLGTGDLNVQNIEIANVGGGGVLFMRYKDGSMIDINGVRASNVVRGIWGQAVLASSVKISNSDIATHPAGIAGIYLRNIPSGLEVTGNTVTGSARLGAVYMHTISNATIAGNTLKDVEALQGWRASIYLWTSHDNRISGNTFEGVSGGVAGIRLRAGSSGNTLGHNDFVKSGLPGWTITTPAGPGAILLDATTLSNDVVGQAKFPGFPDPTAICSQVLDLGDNRIAGMDRCEHMPPLPFALPGALEEEPEEKGH